MSPMPYRKNIPDFYRALLGKLIKVDIFTTDIVKPSDTIHYQPSKEGIVIYTSEIIKLSHELAHLIETKDNSRLFKPDFGMKTYFPITRKGQLQAIAREARTRGIQTRLVEIAFGQCQMLSHRMAAMLVNPPGPIGKFSNAAEVLEWSSSITRSTYHNWNKDKILTVWDDKAKAINEWLETK